MHEQSVSTAVERPVSHGEATQRETDCDLADDPRVLQILSTEHWSLLSARSLAYNEAFTRVAMFLTFLSMSFVGLALLAQATGFTQEFLLIAVIVVGFDFVVGVLTYARVNGTGYDDLRATHGMNRIRHGYVKIVPKVEQFFVTGTHDDRAGVLKTYWADGPSSVLGDIAYGLSTSAGLRRAPR